MLKIIQWCTGVAGKHALRAVIEHPNMELVGCFVMSDEKNGQDAGELCGLPPVGITATNDKDSIYTMDADCVLYMALEEFGLEKPVDEICRLLASGKNVVSTAATGLIYPKACGEDYLQRLEAACQQGGTTFHATGIQPGWAGEILPLTLSAVTGRVDSLLIQEVMDYSSYASPVSMFELMGFGGEPQPVPPVELEIHHAASFGAPLLMMADAMGATIEKMIYQCEVVAAEEDYQVAAGTIKKGTTGGKRYSFTAIIDGQPKLKIEHVTRAGTPVPDDWAKGQGWYITLDGAPNWKLAAEIGHNDQDNNEAGCLAAAMHAFHAIEPVMSADAGVKTLIDLPMIMGKGILGKGFSSMAS